MADDTPAASAAPSPLAWGIALLSFTLLASMIAVGGLGARGYSVALLQQEASRTANQHGGALQLLETDKFAPLFSRNTAQARDWRAVVDLVGQRRYDDALEAINTTTFRRDPHSIFLESLIQQLTRLEEGAEEVKPERREALQRKIGLTYQAYSSLQKDMRHLLGLESEGNVADVPSGDSDPVFYREGYFSGLPVLDGLPDNLDGMKAVATFLPQLEHLDHAAAASLGASLDALRGKSTEVQEQIAQGKRAMTEFDEARDAYRRQVRAQQQKIDDAARGAILALAEPALPAPVVTVYNGLRVISRKLLGRKLPELHTV